MNVPTAYRSKIPHTFTFQIPCQARPLLNEALQIWDKDRIRKKPQPTHLAFAPLPEPILVAKALAFSMNSVCNKDTVAYLGTIRWERGMASIRSTSTIPRSMSFFNLIISCIYRLLIHKPTPFGLTHLLLMGGYDII